MKYKKGDRFELNGDVYVLCAVDFMDKGWTSTNKVLYSLINMENWNRYSSPTTIEDISYLIPKDGFKLINKTQTNNNIRSITMSNEKKLKLINIINRVQNEIEECNDIEMQPGGLSDLGKGRLEMSQEILNMLLDLI